MSKATGTIRALSEAHAKRLKAAFGEMLLTDAKASACERCADLLALAEHYRSKLIDAEAGDIEKLLRLETLADAAVAALGLPATPTKPVVGALEITFVDDAYMRLQSLLQETHPTSSCLRSWRSWPTNSQ